MTELWSPVEIGGRHLGTVLDTSGQFREMLCAEGAGGAMGADGAMGARHAKVGSETWTNAKRRHS